MLFRYLAWCALRLYAAFFVDLVVLAVHSAFYIPGNEDFVEGAVVGAARALAGSKVRCTPHEHIRKCESTALYKSWIVAPTRFFCGG